MNLSIGQIIQHKFPKKEFDADFTVQDDSDGKGAYISHWDKKAMGMTKEEAQSHIDDGSWEVEVTAELEANAYKEKRRAKYPPVEDQLDSIFKGGSDMDAMKTIIDDIKVKYPK